jgi:hypothetical protein
MTIAEHTAVVKSLAAVAKKRRKVRQSGARRIGG